MVVRRRQRRLQFLSKVRLKVVLVLDAEVTNIFHTASSQKSETRPNSSHNNYSTIAAVPVAAATVPRGGALPPTPPMSSDASFDGYTHAPSAKSSPVSQLPPQNYYFDSAPPMGHVDTEAHRQQMVPRMAVQPTYAAHAFASPYMPNPTMASYYPTMQPTPPPQPQVSGLYYQRPLPQVRNLHRYPQPWIKPINIKTRPSHQCLSV